METSPLELPMAANAVVADADTRAAPVAKASRIDDMDIIRGMALFGVLMMNLAEVFRVPYFGKGPRVELGLLERIVMRTQTTFLAGKAMTLFSILFGVGLAIFWERAHARGPGATWLLARRLFFLALFGLAHAFFIWYGDILFLYALTGLVALLFLRVRTWVLLTVIGVCLVWTSVVSLWPAVWSFAIRDPGPGHYDEAIRIYGTGTYLEIVRFRAHELLRFEPTSYIANVPDVLLKMLIGMTVWRTKILDVGIREMHLRKLRWIALTCITLGIGYLLYRWIYFEIYHPPPSSPNPWRRALFLGAVLLTAIGYGSGLLLLLRRAHWRRWLGVFAPLGRMAFTNYLTQSIVFSTVFYGYGLGLIGKLGYAPVALMGIAFYAFQGVVSTIWLRHFRFGPFEWAWRSLTYGRLQPMRRALEANEA